MNDAERRGLDGKQVSGRGKRVGSFCVVGKTEDYFDNTDGILGPYGVLIYQHWCSKVVVQGTPEWEDCDEMITWMDPPHRCNGWGNTIGYLTWNGGLVVNEISLKEQSEKAARARR